MQPILPLPTGRASSHLAAGLLYHKARPGEGVSATGFTAIAGPAAGVSSMAALVMLSV